MGVKERNAATAALDTTRVLIATGMYIGEGFDIPRLDTLFWGLPISWKVSLVRYAGRIYRQFEGKDMVLNYDYLNLRSPPSNHFENLKGKLASRHSIRVKKQWRLLFEWSGDRGEVRDIYLDNHDYR